MKILLTLLLCLAIFSSVAFSDEPKLPHEVKAVEFNRNEADKKQYENIISEFQRYSATISQETRDEVIRYEKSLVKLAKQKKELYKSLSQEAQLYLAKRNAFKRKLPINKRKYVTRDTTSL